jgi:hypothetical protein
VPHERHVHGIIADIQMPGDMDRVGLAAHVRQQRPRASDTLDDATIFFPSGSVYEMASLVRGLNACCEPSQPPNACR